MGRLVTVVTVSQLVNIGLIRLIFVTMKVRINGITQRNTS